MADTAPTFQPRPFLDRQLCWRLPALCAPPAHIRPWLADTGSLTRRLQRLGQFRVNPVHQAVERPSASEAALLAMPPRQHALVREVLLSLDGQTVVYARSVLPLDSLTGANRVLGHMARRSLGAELFKAPSARREAVWYARVPDSRLPGAVRTGAAWGRQSRFRKRGKALLVAEVFLPSLWTMAAQAVD